MPNNPPVKVLADLSITCGWWPGTHHGPWFYPGNGLYYDLCLVWDGAVSSLQMRASSDRITWTTVDAAHQPTNGISFEGALLGCHSDLTQHVVSVTYAWNIAVYPAQEVDAIRINTFDFSAGTSGLWGTEIAGGPTPNEVNHFFGYLDKLSLTRLSTGDFVVGWHDDNVPSGIQDSYLIQYSSGGGWGSTIPVNDQGTGVSRLYDLVVNPTDDVTVLWTETNPTSTIRYSKYASGSLSGSISVGPGYVYSGSVSNSSGSIGGFGLYVAADDSVNFLIADFNTNLVSLLKGTPSASPVWSSNPTQWALFGILGPTIDYGVLAKSIPGKMYVVATNNNDGIIYLSVSTDLGLTWSIPTTYASQTSSGWAPFIARVNGPTSATYYPGAPIGPAVNAYIIGPMEAIGDFYFPGPGVGAGGYIAGKGNVALG